MTPANTWYAGRSTDGGNNSGWIFTAPPAPSANVIIKGGKVTIKKLIGGLGKVILRGH